MSFVYVWQYEVRPDTVEEFERVYGPGGEWTELFERAQGYLRTELHRDVDEPLRYITFDYWESRDDRDAFRQTFSNEFDELEVGSEELIETESFIGDFEAVESS